MRARVRAGVRAPIRVSCARGFIGQALGHVWGMFVPHVLGMQGVTMYILLYVCGGVRVCVRVCGRT